MRIRYGAHTLRRALRSDPRMISSAMVAMATNHDGVRGEPIFFAYSPTMRTVFLCEHNGSVTRINGKTFSDVLPAGGDPADVALSSAA